MASKNELVNTQEAILAVDIGTTNLKCYLYRKNLEIINSSCQKLKIVSSFDGCSELDSHNLMSCLTDCLEKTLKTTEKLKIKCFGLSTQRNSFILWNRNTGKTYTNFILWNDKRDKKTCNTLNKGFVLNTIKKSSILASKFINNHRINTVSNYRVDQTHIAPKLINQLKILESRLETEEFEAISYGTIETYLIWALGKEKLFVTDITCVCCTGFYDMFQNKWSDLLLYIFGIPNRILPQVKDTCDDFGVIKNEYTNLNYDVPIRSIIGDSQSSLIAEGAFEIGDCVITIGTGSFISVNIGNKPLSSHNRAYPLAGYKFKEEKFYILHCFVSSAGSAIDWAESIGLFKSHNDIDDLLNNVKSSNGVYFIPAFGLLEIEGADKNGTAAGFIGVEPTTSKAEMLMAVFESIAILIKNKLEMILKDLNHYNITLRSIRLCGGVTRSEYFCQLLSNLLGFRLEKSNFSDTSSAYGAGFLAGVSAGMYQNLQELNKYRKVEKVYQPDQEEIKRNGGYEKLIKNWERALNRFLNWNGNKAY